MYGWGRCVLRQKGRTQSSTKLDVKNEPIFPGNGFDLKWYIVRHNKPEDM